MLGKETVVAEAKWLKKVHNRYENTTNKMTREKKMDKFDYYSDTNTVRERGVVEREIA